MTGKPGEPPNPPIADENDLPEEKMPGQDKPSEKMPGQQAPAKEAPTDEEKTSKYDL